MPVTNTQQARIILSQKQLIALKQLLNMQITLPPMLAIEETNIENTVVMISKNGQTLLHHGGECHNLGGKGAISSGEAG